MAIICNDFIAIAKELEEFYNIFTPELKSVTGKPHKINEILERVHKVLELIEHVRNDESMRRKWISFCFYCSGALRSVSSWRLRQMENGDEELRASNRRDRRTNEKFHFWIVQKSSVRKKKIFIKEKRRSFSSSQFCWKCVRYVVEIREKQYSCNDPRRNAKTF